MNLHPPPARSLHPSLTRRSFLIAGAAGALGLTLDAATHGRHDIQVTHRTLAIRNLPDAFLGFRFVQLSDIHLLEWTQTSTLQHAVALINQLAPELLVLTGDFVCHDPLPAPVAWKAAGIVAEVLSTLTVPQRFAILGNHDVAVGVQHVVPVLQAHGTPFLIDTHIAIERGTDRLWFAGTNDATTLPGLLPSTLPKHPDAPVILLCHEPDYIDTLLHFPAFTHVDLMLAGHSHGGQIRLPFLGPLILPPLGLKYVEGLFHIGATQLYVNRGLGTIGLPLRLNCPPEITHFTLTRA